MRNNNLDISIKPTFTGHGRYSLKSQWSCLPTQ